MNTEARGISGQIYFDGHTVTILRRGFFPWLIHGSSGTKSIPISAVTAIQHRRQGIYKGYLQLSVQGELEAHGGRNSAQQQSLARDENTIVFHFLANKAFQKMADTLRAAVYDAHSGVVQPTSADAMKMIEELGALRDSGYITPSDFETKKQELLDKIFTR